MIKRIERSEGTRWQVYGKRAGKKVYVSTHESKRDAQAADEEFRVTQRKIAAGELPEETDLKRTFRMGVAVWIKTLNERKSRSAWEYENRCDNHLLEAFGEVPIVAITKVMVIRWRDRASSTTSAATLNGLLATLSSAFTFFVEQRWIEHNPCHRVKNLEVVTKVFPWLQSTETVTRLLASCLTNIRTLVAVLVGTGMRLGEALHLHWDDIDIEHRIITVRRGSQGTTKSGKIRRVPIIDSTLSVLKQMKLERGTNKLLWPGQKKGKPLHQSSITKAFHLATARAELPKELRVHDLRHTFASLFLIDGGDIWKLSKILGHSSVMITERTYAHLKPTAYEADYGRVAFQMPSESDNVIAFASGAA